MMKARSKDSSLLSWTNLYTNKSIMALRWEIIIEEITYYSVTKWGKYLHYLRTKSKSLSESKSNYDRCLKDGKGLQ